MTRQVKYIILVLRGNQVQVLSDPVTVSRERSSLAHCRPNSGEKGMSVLICSQETCLTEEMGLRARPYICGRVTGIAVPPAAVG